MLTNNKLVCRKLVPEQGWMRAPQTQVCRRQFANFGDFFYWSPSDKTAVGVGLVWSICSHFSLQFRQAFDFAKGSEHALLHLAIEPLRNSGQADQGAVSEPGRPPLHQLVPGACLCHVRS
jgi:hypothetical protein